MAVVTEQDGGRARLLETRVAHVFFYASSGNKIYWCIYSRPNISAFLFHSRDMFSAFSEILTFTRLRAFVFDASVWKLYKSGAYLRDFSRFPRRRLFMYTANRHRVSPKFYQIARLRTDDVHYG